MALDGIIVVFRAALAIIKLKEQATANITQVIKKNSRIEFDLAAATGELMVWTNDHRSCQD